jgi:hypothetical protein
MGKILGVCWQMKLDMLYFKLFEVVAVVVVVVHFSIARSIAVNGSHDLLRMDLVRIVILLLPDLLRMDLLRMD